MFPGWWGNLISVGRLNDSGYQVSFEAEGCTITQGRVHIQGMLEGNLYYIRNPRTDEQDLLGLATNETKVETMDVWHRLL